LPAIVLLTALTGLTSELYRPAAAALLIDLVPADQRVTAFAAYRLAFNAGWAFGPATAGFLAEHSFFWLFVGDAVTSALFGVVAWTALPHGVRSSQKESGWMDALKVLRRDRRFLQFLAASLAIALVFFQMSSTFGLHVTGLGFSAATYGALISLNGVLVVLLELPLTIWTRRFPPRQAMAVGYLLIGSGFALNAVARSVPALACVILIFTLGEMVAMPVAGAYVADLAPSQLRGRYLGALGFTWALALVCGPGLGMVLFAYGPLTLWLTFGALGALAAVIILHEFELELGAVPETR